MNASVIGAALYAVEVIGIAAFALSGIIEAARRRMDAVGVTAVAGLAAFGGGTLRDFLLDRRPLFWVEHSELLWLVLALALGSLIFLRGRHLALTERAMQLPDAIGLGLEQWLCLLLGASSATLMRVAAVLRDWRIPQWKTEQ
ncbi:MAG: hypothetical protein FJY35_02150 [Betaproteobacteria bacterium]|nr:hypothetical protein [Betaproteobacteria bacterium]